MDTQISASSDSTQTISAGNWTGLRSCSRRWREAAPACDWFSLFGRQAVDSVLPEYLLSLFSSPLSIHHFPINYFSAAIRRKRDSHPTERLAATTLTTTVTGTRHRKQPDSGCFGPRPELLLLLLTCAASFSHTWNFSRRRVCCAPRSLVIILRLSIV